MSRTLPRHVQTLTTAVAGAEYSYQSPSWLGTTNRRQCRHAHPDLAFVAGRSLGLNHLVTPRTRLMAAALFNSSVPCSSCPAARRCLHRPAEASSPSLSCVKLPRRNTYCVRPQAQLTDRDGVTNTQDSSARTSVPAETSGSISGIQQPPGKLLAAGAVGFAVAAFLFSRFGTGVPSLGTLEQASMPLDTALANGKPTIMEFYASWCEICRESAPEVYQVRRTPTSCLLPVKKNPKGQTLLVEQLFCACLIVLIKLGQLLA